MPADEKVDWPNPHSLPEVLIAPFSTLAELREWAAGKKLTLPWTADPDGSAARMCVAERCPRALVLGSDGKVVRVISGVDELAQADWKTLLP